MLEYSSLELQTIRGIDYAHYHHLTHEQRCHIYVLKKSGSTQREIAQELGVSASTISRELLRNRGERGYRHEQAHKISVERRARASQKIRKMTSALLNQIRNALKERWSPEQISGRLKRDGIEISHEWIYRWIWADKHSGGTYYRYVRHSGKRYVRRSGGKSGRGHIPNRRGIEERPAIVEQKSRVGDFEGDLIVGVKHQGALVSYVDRHSKFVLLGLVENKTAAAVTEATRIAFSLGPVMPSTITYDNGKEFSAHETISRLTGAECFFARPYHAWERGLNEHTNGLVPQFFPKHTNFKKISAEEVERVEEALNNRPRKVLGFRTPKEVLTQMLIAQNKIALHC